MLVFSWMSWIFVGAVVLVLLLLVVTVWMFAEYLGLRGHFNPDEYLIGEIGTVKKECTPHQRGKVYADGAYWDAVSEFGHLAVGDDIRVVAVKDKFLVVQKVDLVGSGSKQV
jgi:membrane protein implicated in regulation of membrane protease activity